MPRNGFFGVCNSHFAICTDEDALTYSKPVHVPGTVGISMEPSVESTTVYADNEPWIDKTQDNGGSGTMSFYDVESTDELRKLLADLTGYMVTKDGRMNLTANRKPKKFAFMCEQPGHVMGKRRCLLMCEMGKPTCEANTNQEAPEVTQLDFPFKWVPVIPTGGTYENRTSGYDDYAGNSGYGTFFDAVKVEGLNEPAVAAAASYADRQSNELNTEVADAD